ncbi:PAS domain-containing protein [Pseudobutyrivibrio sp. MD2005]|uniref:PAS domain-containing protein n=1 Tax=Pseudobutyrivibrio sp. MD2005 TaxID=1410616 RepID=UPI00068501CE|nr:PAS domain-containing protein [Pseudobutyrivibrio sp. MD2005]
MEEKIANAEKEVEASAARVTASNITIEKREAAKKQAEIVGHPLHLFTKENEALNEEIENAKSLIIKMETEPSEANSRRINAIIDNLRKVAIHYAKKGDLLYPHMKAKYEISGPSDVMWSVDDEIRDELKFIADSDFRKIEYVNRLEHAITRMEEMIYKEQNILFPICTRFFTNEEWYQIYQDSKDYAPCLVDFIKWPEAEEVLSKKKANSKVAEDIINLPGGHFTPAQLRAVLNTLPVEISFIDENDINCFFNEGPKLFKRAGMAIGRDVYSCHPPKIEMMVRSIIGDFKSGTRDKVSVWMEKEGNPVLVEYIAVRDDNGQYIGTMECVQKMDEAKKHFEK